MCILLQVVSYISIFKKQFKRKEKEAHVKNQGSSHPGCQAFASPCPSRFLILHPQTLDQMVSKNPTGTTSLRFCEFTYLLVTEFAGKFGKRLPSMLCREKGAGCLLWARPRFQGRKGLWKVGGNVATLGGNVSFNMNHLLQPQ